MATPSDDEAATKQKIAERAVSLVQGETHSRPQILGVELGGSFAKGTWLAGEADIDIFVKFAESTAPQQFTSISREVGFAAMKAYGPYERYADHPYVEANMEGTKINVVPCYDVAQGEWKSAADRSPYHTRYMKAHLTNAMKGDVRLLKRLLKAQGIYGAQMSKQGFSGYVAEVLVLHFGGFGRVIESMARIGRGHVIGDAVKKFETPVVIIDPIDGSRNLAAAISGRNMGLFILACRALLDNPAGAMFGLDEPVPREDWGGVIAAKFRYSKRSPETIWGQAKSAATSTVRQLELNGFVVIRHEVLVDESAIHILFLLESLCIPPKFVREGPDIFRREDVAKFIEKNRDGLVWISADMRVLCTEKRRHTQAASLLESLLATPKKTGIPAGLHADIRGGYTILTGEELDQSVKREAIRLVSADGAVLSSG